MPNPSHVLPSAVPLALALTAPSVFGIYTRTVKNPKPPFPDCTPPEKFWRYLRSTLLLYETG